MVIVSRWLRVAVPLALALALPPDARAAVTAASTAQVPGSALVGDRIGIGLSLEATGDAPGFWPAFEVLLPSGLKAEGATSGGNTLRLVEIADGAIHPLTGESRITVPAGRRLYAFTLPLSSLAPGAGALSGSVAVQVAPEAALGVALEFEARGLFAGGADALLNPATDPPVRSAVARGRVTPSLLTVTHGIGAASGGARTPTGPSYPIALRSSIDLATAKKVTGFDYDVALDSGFRLVRVDVPAGCTVLSPTSAPTAPGGVVRAHCSEVTGVTGRDRELVVWGYIPEKRADGTFVLDPATGLAPGGGSAILRSTVRLSALATPEGTTLPDDEATLSLEPVALAVRESIENASRPGEAPRPGDTVAVTQRLFASDYFAFEPGAMASTLGRGLTYATGSSTPFPATATGDDPTTLDLQTPAIDGPALSGTPVTNTLRALVDELYVADGDRLLAGDVLPTRHVYSAQISDISGTTWTGDEAAGLADASVSLGSAAATQVVSAVDGRPRPAQPPPIEPTEKVSFRITAKLSMGDTGGLVLTEFLPLPIFDVAEYAESTLTVGAKDGEAPIRWGPDADDAFFSGDLAPSVERLSGANALRFTFPAFHTDAPTRALTIDLVIEATVTDRPAPDGAAYTAFTTGSWQGTTGTHALPSAIAPLVVLEPNVIATLGAIASDAAHTKVTPVLAAYPSAPYTTTILEATPETGEAIDLDAGDEVTWRLVVRNAGGRTAWGTRVRAALPAGLELVQDSVVVRSGAGDAIDSTGDLFAGGLGIAPPLAARHATSALDVAVIDFRTVTGPVPAGAVLAPTVEVFAYAGSPSPGAPNHVTSPKAATGRARTAPFVIRAELVDGPAVSISERARWTLTVQVPEGATSGVVVEAPLPGTGSGRLLAAVSPAISVTASLPISFTGSPDAVVPVDRTRATWSLGTITNTARDNEARLLSWTFEAVVLGASANVHGVTIAYSPAATWGSFDAGASLSRRTDTRATVQVREPLATHVLTLGPTTADAGDTVAVTLRTTLDRTGTRPKAYDASATLTLPAGLAASLGEVTFEGCPTGAAAVPGTTSVQLSLGTLDATTPCVARFDAKLVDDPAVFAFGAVKTLSSQLSFTSAEGRDLNAINGLATSFERTTRVTSTATVTVPLPRTATSALRPVTPVRVGDTLEYEASVSLPEGSGAFVVTDQLPSALRFLSAPPPTVPAGVTCAPVACAQVAPSIETSGRLRWNFGTVTVAVADGAPRELTLGLKAAVANTVAARNQGVVSNEFVPSPGARITFPTTTIIEPVLTIASAQLVARTTGPLDAGNDAHVQLVLRNASGTSDRDSWADAHDVTVRVDLTNLLAEGEPILGAGCHGPRAAVVGERAIELSFERLALDGTCTVSMPVRVPQRITFPGNVSYTATLAWTSLPGDAVPPAEERTGSGSGSNQYRTSRAVTVPLATPASLQLTIDSTDQTFTNGVYLAFGEHAVMRARVTMSEGLHSGTVVRLTPPRALRILSARLDTTGFSGTVELHPDPAAPALGPGESATWTLGEVVVDANNVSTDDSFSVLVDTVATLAAGRPSGATIDVIARLASDGRDASSSGTAIGFSAPGPELWAQANVTDPTPGKRTTFKAMVRNAGSVPACDTWIAAKLPPGFTLVPPGTDAHDNDFDRQVDEADEAAYGLEDGTARLPIPGCVGSFEFANFELLGNAPLDLATTPVPMELQLGTYRTLPTGGELVDPLDDGRDNDRDGKLDALDEEGDDRLIQLVDPRVAEPVLHLTVADLTGDPATLEPGDELGFTLVARNRGDGATASLTITTKLPLEDGTLLPVTAPGGDSVFVAGGSLVWRPGVLAAGASRTLAWRLKTADRRPRGTVVETSSVLAGGDGPDVPSDDPTTPEPADVTRITFASTSDPDADGVRSGDDPAPNDPAVCGDSDRDRCDDCAVAHVKSPADDGTDGDADGLCATGDGDDADADADEDGVADGEEPRWWDDTDGDGLVNALDADSDDDGIFDGTELGRTTPHAATQLSVRSFIADADPTTTTNPLEADSDHGGVRDGAEDWNHDGRFDAAAGESDPLAPGTDLNAPDADGDGAPDREELLAGTDPADADSDDDGLLDGHEQNAFVDSDGDGLIGALDVDSDDDGLLDGTERGVASEQRPSASSERVFRADLDPQTVTSALVADTDRGGRSDGAEDVNRNGKLDADESDPSTGADDATLPDADADGLPDRLEQLTGSDPHDADTDDDGLPDGAEPNPSQDPDGDTFPSPVDADSDDDGLLDGTELGITAESVASRPDGGGTNRASGNFRPDADPATRTCALVADTDRGGIADGREDLDLNGRMDAGESDPTSGRGADDRAPADQDADGLPDALERAVHSDPDDADSDDDGVSDGREPGWSVDLDGDGLPGVLDADQDDDGVLDGTELGLTATQGGDDTDLRRGAFVPDLDPTTRTSPLARDTDRGGVPDGAEDTNHDGRVDPGEGNPRAVDDDAAAPADADADGLTDAQERLGGTNPADADSDDDGLVDGAEPNWWLDMDRDGKIDALDADSDGDGLLDGTERGLVEADVTARARAADTDLSRGAFRPDADPATRTAVLEADTDRGGLGDGIEDTNLDGHIVPPESDPLDPGDDAANLARDSDGDGIPDALEGAGDPDGDGIPSASDPDSDGDGITDAVESGSTSGLPRDTDDDGAPDFLDEDTDDDGVPDADEAKGGADGAPADTDGDGVPDFRDPDSDEDGIPDRYESGADTDGDGEPDFRDQDADDDGLPDAVERGEPGPDGAPRDTDGDGLSDARDVDSDADGIRDGLTASGARCSAVPAGELALAALALLVRRRRAVRP